MLEMEAAIMHEGRRQCFIAKKGVIDNNPLAATQAQIALVMIKVQRFLSQVRTVLDEQVLQVKICIMNRNIMAKETCFQSSNDLSVCRW